jgi:predicted nucleic acid-binding protein
MGPKTSDVRADLLVVLDACVLIPASLRDTLLRLAEPPRLYVPRWSEEIIVETVRNLQNRIRLSTEKTDYLVGQLRKHFADCWVLGHEHLIASMDNHPKDRHVLAAAVKCGAQVIVTYNQRDFPTAIMERWGIEVQGPSTFLSNLYDLAPSSVVEKLERQAQDLGRTLREQLAVLRNAVPAFVESVCQGQGISLNV